MPITPGTPLADTDLPAATADAQTNAAAIRTAIGAADAATNTGDETEGSILDKLKGAAADATRIGAEFLPDALSGAGDPNGAATATATLDPVGTNNGIVLTAVTPGTAGNAISMMFTVAGYPRPVDVVVIGNQMGIVAGSATTAQNVIDAVNAFPAASALITATNAPGSNGTGLMAAVNQTFLTGGTDGAESVTAAHIGQLYRDTTNDVWYRATQLDPPVWEEDVGVTNANVNTAIAANVANTQIALGGGTAGRALFGAADAAAARTTLELGATNSPTFGGLDLLTDTTTTLNVYNSLSGANFERLSFSWASNIARIGTAKGGTGTARAMEFQTDGTTRLTLPAAGAVTVANRLNVTNTVSTYSIANPFVALTNAAGKTAAIFPGVADGAIGFSVDSVTRFFIGGSPNSGLEIPSANSIAWVNPGVQAFSHILQDSTSPQALAIRNGTNAQALRLYNTFTSATNFERINFRWSANVAFIGTEKGSAGGTARDLVLETDGTERVRVSASGNVGIGTTSPTEKLDVVGNIKASGTLTVTGESTLDRLKATIPNYADDAAADADAGLLSGQLYRTTAGGRTVYQKP